MPTFPGSPVSASEPVSSKELMTPSEENSQPTDRTSPGRERGKSVDHLLTAGAGAGVGARVAADAGEEEEPRPDPPGQPGLLGRFAKWIVGRS